MTIPKLTLPANPPYIFDEDKDWIDLEKHQDFINAHKYIEDLHRHSFLFGLLPVPYSGNIRKAKVVILMLNPDFSISDMHWEQSIDKLKEELITQIKQEGLNKEHPFWPFNPDYSQHEARSYWLNILKNVIQQMVCNKGCSYENALNILSKELAVIQYYPYHSAKGPKSVGKIKEISENSTKQIVQFVKNELAPNVGKGKRLIIVVRKAKEWDLPNSDYIIKGMPRNGHFPDPTVKAILDILENELKQLDAAPAHGLNRGLRTN